jgi:hypothetical protein
LACHCYTCSARGLTGENRFPAWLVVKKIKYHLTLQVLSSNLETKQKLAPYLKHPVLRRVIQTFTNDEDGNMGKWACNPEVQRLLSEAKRLMDEGHVAEKEMERLLISHLEVDNLSLAAISHLVGSSVGPGSSIQALLIFYIYSCNFILFMYDIFKHRHLDMLRRSSVGGKTNNRRSTWKNKRQIASLPTPIFPYGQAGEPAYPFMPYGVYFYLIGGKLKDAAACYAHYKSVALGRLDDW